MPESGDRHPHHGNPHRRRARQVDQVDALTTAALELDQTTATTIINRILRAHGVVVVDTTSPGPGVVGDAVNASPDGGQRARPSNLLSECIRTALSAVIWRRRRWNRCAPVLLAAPDGVIYVSPCKRSPPLSPRCTNQRAARRLAATPSPPRRRHPTRTHRDLPLGPHTRHRTTRRTHHAPTPPQPRPDNAGSRRPGLAAPDRRPGRRPPRRAARLHEAHASRTPHSASDLASSPALRTRSGESRG